MNSSNKIRDFAFYFVIAGIIARVVFFVINLFVGGNNVDEAMIAANGASLAENMTDISGEKLPVYFDTWIVGGQSPFPTYIVALFVKIFGYSLFSVRLPSLIISIISLCFAYLFSKEAFGKDKKMPVIFCALCAFSPWLIYTGIYTMDCNYLGHLIIIAFYFIAKAINTAKTRFYVLAMLFFSLCFYSYIASILLIPFLLASLYIILLVKKNISIKNTVISVISAVLFSLVFIIWGLVVLKVIPRFELFGFSFYDMPGYERGSDVVFAFSGIGAIIKNIITNWLSVFVLMLMPDYNSSMALGTNIFQYGNLLSGIFAALGLVKLAFMLKNCNKSYTFITKALSLSSLTAILVYCGLVSNACNGTLYRYGILTYMLILPEAVGMCEFVNILSKIDYKKIVAFYSLCSLITTSIIFGFCYVPQMDSSSEVSKIISLYGDYFYDCLDFAEENGYESIVVSKDPYDFSSYVYTKLYYSGEKELYTTSEELEMDSMGNTIVPITKDNCVSYVKPENIGYCDNDFIIVYTENLDNSLKPGYNTKAFGYFTVIYK